jgi:ABC-type nitrate/sulfonate/bicarbonate transport system permease component
MEPYMTAEDFNRLGVEIVFMILVFYYILSFIFEIVVNLVRGRLSHWAEQYGAAYIIMDSANFGINS